MRAQSDPCNKARHLGCEDLPGTGIEADVQFAGGLAFPGAMLFDQPLAGAAQPQATAVD
jgi:hypothetical protein